MNFKKEKKLTNLSFIIKMYNNSFIGTGNNPDGPDLPLGLGVQLAQDPMAMDAFGKMSNEQKDSLIRYIQGAVTGEDAKERIASAVSRLHNNQF